MECNEEIDALGLLCPLPVLKLRKRLQNAVIDVPHFCNEAGHELLQSREIDQGRIYQVRKG